MFKTLLISGGALVFAIAPVSAQVVGGAGGALGGEPQTGGISGSAGGSLDIRTDAVDTTGEAVNAARAETRSQIEDVRNKTKATTEAAANGAEFAAAGVEVDAEVSASGSAGTNSTDASAAASASASGSPGAH